MNESTPSSSLGAVVSNLSVRRFIYSTYVLALLAPTPDELLDADTNLTFAVPYLANAYTVAGGDPARAVRPSSGYYYEAKRKGLLGPLRTARSAPVDGSPTSDAARTGLLLPSPVER